MDVRKKLEQIRRNKKNKNKPKGTTNSTNTKGVKDLRQIITKKTKQKGPKTRDLRETSKKLTSRVVRPTSASRTDRPATRSTKRTASNDKPASRPTSRNYPTAVYPQQQYYVPPHMRGLGASQYIVASQPDPRRSNPAVSASIAPRQGNASILISNLHPKITQSEIIELCSDIGPMSGLNFINQSTVIATFQNSSDAVKAVKIYNNRLLDGRPMSVNMMPNLV